MATTIPMLAPDGTSGEIPAARMQDAIKAGFKPAVEMLAPDGKTKGYIPFDRGADAAKAGFKLSAPEANLAGEGVYAMWDDAGHKLAVPYSHVPIVRAQGYQFDTNADQTGMTPGQRFQKDSATGLEPRGGWTNGDVFRGAVAGVKNMFMHPLDTVAAMGQPFVASGMAPGGMYPTAGPGRAGDMQASAEAQQQAEEGQRGAAKFIGENPAYALGGVAGPAIVTAGVAEAAPRIAPMVADVAGNASRTMLAGDVNAPIPGTDLTPAARYESMKAMGLQPNAAEATNSTPLNIAEKVNQNSLTAARTYADARASNLTALKEYTKDLLNSMSTKGAEEGGAAVQQGLRNAQVKLQNDAAQGFSQLDEAMGSRKLSGQTLQQTAKNIYDSYADYAGEHPALVPKEAWKIVRDLARADNGFESRPMSFPEVHQLRSDLLEMVRTNPDIVKNQAGGWLQRLADAADQTMTSGATGLNPEGTRIFRDANQAWADMKGTYDNPSHSFYQAVRTQSPSTLLNGIQQTPEIARMLQEALGPEGIGPIQRGVAEKALGTTKEGGFNFKTFQGQWNKLRDYRKALFTPEQMQQLEDIGNAGTVLHEDANPSGSARLGQGIAEGAEALRSVTNPRELLGNLAYHGAQYGLGKLMNNPAFVDWLMKGRGFSPIRDAPAVRTSGAFSAFSDKDRTGPLGQPNFYSDEYLRMKAELDAANAKQ